jgi:hypothetical protein
MSIKVVDNSGKIEFDSSEVLNQATLSKFLLNSQKLFKKYKKTKEAKAIYDELNNKEFKIAIVANMSSGKSTFVNSLFGKDILPSFNEATTDCPTYIHSGEGENRLIVNFEDDKESVEIKNNIIDEIKVYARKDSPDMSLEYMNVKDIHLYYDFLNLKNRDDLNFKFTFIDTAGPNNKGDFSQKHQNFTEDVILNEADFIIFLFDYGQLDANLDSDGLGLWDLIKKRKAQDEFFDVMFMINKLDMAIDDNESDDKPRGHFEKKAIEKLEYFAMTKHGFDNPKVLGVSSSYAFLSRVDVSADKSLSRKYKKILIDFEEINEAHPKDEVLKYSNIENVEKIILEYIENSVENVLVNKASHNTLEILNSIYKELNEARDTLGSEMESYRQEIRKVQELENGEFYQVISDIRRDINLLFNKTINEKKERIIELFDNSIQADIDKVIFESMKGSFQNILDNRELKIDKKTININYKKANKDTINPNKLRDKFIESFNWLIKRREIKFIEQYKELLLKEDNSEFVNGINSILNDGTQKLSRLLQTQVSANNSIKQFSFFDNIDINISKDLSFQPKHISVMMIREVKQVKDSYVIQNRIEENGYKTETRYEENGVTKVLQQLDKVYTVKNIPKYEMVEVKVPQYKITPEKVYQYKTRIDDNYRITLYIEAMKKHLTDVSYSEKLDFIKYFESNLRKRFSKVSENLLKSIDDIEKNVQGDLGQMQQELVSIEKRYETLSTLRNSFISFFGLVA